MEVSSQIKPKYVAYLDVLGWKEIVNKDNDPRIDVYFNAITDSIEELQGDGSVDRSLMSDATVLACPATTEGLRSLLKIVQSITIKLCGVGILIRGGISVGGFALMDEFNIVVGKGLVNAYLMESTHAKMPRVLIDPKVIRFEENDFKNRETFVHSFNYDRVGPGGKMLDNPLIDSNEDGLHVAFASELIKNEKYLMGLHQHMATDMYRSQEHLPKYRWVRNYVLQAISRFAGNLRMEAIESQDKKLISERDKWTEWEQIFNAL